MPQRPVVADSPRRTLHRAGPWMIVLRSMRAALLLIGLAASSSGCVYSVPTVWVPPEVPMSSVDVAASEVVLDAPSGDLAVESARELRASVAELLGEAVVGRTGRQGRFRAEVTFVDDVSALEGLTNGPTVLFLPVFALFIPAGLSNGRGAADVSLAIEVDGATFVGRGRGVADGSIHADAVTRATSIALQDALSKLTRVDRRAAPDASSAPADHHRSELLPPPGTGDHVGAVR